MAGANIIHERISPTTNISIYEMRAAEDDDFIEGRQQQQKLHAAGPTQHNTYQQSLKH